MAAFWTFVDMNSYFASCEQQARVELRGQPVGVVPVLADTTCFIAASYEAKRFGVKTGTPVWEGKKLCPDLIIVEARPMLYRAMHKEVVKAVEQVIPVHEVLSVDEMVCKPWKNEQSPDDIMRLGAAIQNSVLENVGSCMGCSVGGGPSPFIAKVAGELRKPRGISVITLDELPDRLLHMKLTDWPGIAAGMERRFNAYGVTTTAEMYRLSAHEMRGIFGGIVGQGWWEMIRGHVVPMPKIKRFQIGHSNVLAPDFRNYEGATAVVFRMLEKAAQRLRAEGFLAQRLEVHVMSATERPWSRKTDFAATDRTDLFRCALRKLWTPTIRTPKSVGVNLQRILRPEDSTANLLDGDRRSVDLDIALDELNRRYGSATVTGATALRAAQYLSHERIPFGKPTDFG